MTRGRKRGPTLVLLPGLDGTGTLFARVRPLLAEWHETVVVAYPPRPATRGELLATIAEALPAAGDYVLVAESFSGPLAVQHAAVRPARLRALVLVATFAHAPVPRVFRLLAGAVRLPPPRAGIRWLLVGRDAGHELVADVQAAVRSVPAAVRVERLRQVFDVDVRPLLADVVVPVLLLTGQGDRLVPARAAAAFARAWPRLEQHAIDGPHLLLQARPRQAAAAILRFVRAGV
jgi:pimeloyl-[acyl-carrier protein] methyl ester esterase